MKKLLTTVLLRPLLLFILVLAGCSEPSDTAQQAAWMAYYLGDKQAAYESFQAAAEQSDDALSAMAASLLAQEQGDREGGAHWLQQAASMGSPAAIYTQVTNTYRSHDGHLPPEKMAQAVTQLTPLAKQDYTPATLALGVMLATDDNASSESLKEAFAYIKQAHTAGSPLASFTLGLAHVMEPSELDIDLSLLKNFQQQPKKGVQYLEEALSDDFVLPAFFLASIYEQGMPGIQPDIEKAQHYQNQLSDNIFSLIRNFELAELEAITLEDLLSKPQRDSIISTMKSQAAEQDVDALVALAQLHHQGKLVKQDDAQAKAYYQQAAEQGSGLAIWHLAEQSTGKTWLSYLEQAAELDYVPALKELIRGYDGRNNLDVQQSKVLSTRYLKRVAELGDTEAQIQLAQRYFAGEGVPTSVKQAQVWLEKVAAAHPESADVFLRLANVIDSDDDAAIQMAIDYYQQAHQLHGQGGFAAYMLAGFYRSGKGVAQDSSKALALYEEVLATDSDSFLFDNAKFQVARYYHAGGNDFPQDLPRAQQLLQELAEDDHETAMVMLAEDYLAGNGLAQDEAQAIALFQQAAEWDNEHALVRLSLLAWPNASAAEREELRQQMLEEAQYLAGDSPLRPQVYALMDATNKAELQWLVDEAGDAGYQDPRAAEFLASLAATHSTPLIQYFHGLVLLKDINSAAQGLEKLEQAADSGLQVAMAELGDLYSSRSSAYALPEPDTKQAVDWLTKAAQSPEATDDDFKNLGDIYYRGSGDVTRDYAKALAWYGKISAASLDSADGFGSLKRRIANLKDSLSQVDKLQKAYQQGDLEAGFELAGWYRDQHHGLTDTGKALVIMKSLAAKGLTKAQMALANNSFYYHYFHLTETERSQNYLAAANNGDSHAMQAIADRLLQGTGIEADRAQARAWYEKYGHSRSLGAMDDFERNKKHAQQGDVVAQYQLGNAYKNGKGTSVDGEQAAHYLKLAAEAGHSKAFYPLAEVYSEGLTGVVDWQAAIEWYRKAETQSRVAYFEEVVTPAEQGDVAAMTQLGEDYLPRYSSSITDTTKRAYAIDWLEKASSQGSGKASYLLADEYKRGFDTPAEDKKNYQHYLELAAEQGSPEAQYRLAQQLLDQEQPSQQDRQRIISLLQQAAEQGQRQAFSSLLSLYQNGTRNGFSPQPDQTLPLLKASCNQHVFACRELADAYLNGLYEIDVDSEKAIQVLRGDLTIEDAHSQRMLADIYLRGMAGATADWEQADALLEKLYNNNLTAAVEGYIESVKLGAANSTMPDIDEHPASASQISQLLRHAYETSENDMTEQEKQPHRAMLAKWMARAFDEEGNRGLIDSLIEILMTQEQYGQAYYYAVAAGEQADTELRQAAAEQLDDAEQARIVAQATAAAQSNEERRYRPFIDALTQLAENANQQAIWYQLAQVYMGQQYVAEDLVKAAGYLEQAGKAGMTGSFRLAGDLMREQDNYAAAVDYYAQGGDAGDMIAAHMAGDILASGRSGVTVDNRRALHYYELTDPAQDSRHAQAKHNAAKIYYHMQPIGQENSLKKARALLELAAEYGDTSAGHALQTWDFGDLDTVAP